MLNRDFEGLPAAMKSQAVHAYYDMLYSRRSALAAKRVFDAVLSLLLLALLSPLLAFVPILIKCDSRGPVFYRQTRVTRNMRRFRIFKFRTMSAGADRAGPLVTVAGDTRITRVGKTLRKFRIDELPQLLNVLKGDMTFVGTRPEVPEYVLRYNDEMKATLLLPAGITSEASLRYRDESRLLAGSKNPEETYADVVLPQKMVYNLQYLRDFSLAEDFKILFGTAAVMLGKKQWKGGVNG